MKKTPTVIVTILLLALVAGNVLQFIFREQKTEYPNTIMFSNANSRDTYFSIHNIAEAHKLSKGVGIKVGIIDWNFGIPEHSDIYTDVLDFTGSSNNHLSGHGYWMAAVLKEIAPECEVYGLGVGTSPYDESGFVNVMNEVVIWSIENGIDVLTLSFERISDANRAKFDEAVNKAFGYGIATTFIHCDNPNNILPFGLVDYNKIKLPYAREPDINVFHYDYNAVQLNYYMQFLESGPAKSIDDIIKGGYIPFYSNSSLSPVTAGFIAILKGINNTLSPAEYKKILVETSYAMHFSGGVADFEDADVEYVVDIGKAVKYLQDNYYFHP